MRKLDVCTSKAQDHIADDAEKNKLGNSVMKEKCFNTAPVPAAKTHNSY